jgi:hypothetical protein
MTVIRLTCAMQRNPLTAHRTKNALALLQRLGAIPVTV